MSSRAVSAYLAPGVLGFLGLIGLLATGWLSAQPASAQSSPGSRVTDSRGGIVVQIVNGTAGGAVSDIPLAVYMADGQKTEAVKEGKSDAQGKAAWPDLTGPVSARFVVSTTYQGVVYTTEPAALPAPAVSLRVYEATGDDKAIKIGKAGMVVLQVDAQAQTIRLLETLTLHNSGDRTFLPSADGSRGPMGLLRFGLPDGAGNLTANGRLGASSIIQVNAGFATDMPLSPGDTEANYTYEVAYGALSEGGYAKLSRSFPYPVDALSLLVTQGDFSVQVPGLAEKGTAAVGTRQYRQWTGASFPAHTELSLELRNLPLVLPVLRPGNPAIQIVLGVMVFAAVAFPVIYTRRYRHSNSPYGGGARSLAGAAAGESRGVAPPRLYDPQRGRTIKVRRVNRVDRRSPAEKESEA